MFQVDHSVRQRLGLDCSTLPNQKKSKSSSGSHVLVIDLLDPNFIKKSGSEYNGHYRRVQWALGPENCLPLDFIGSLGLPIIESEWEIYQQRFQSLLRENGSPNSVVEFVKSKIEVKKVTTKC